MPARRAPCAGRRRAGAALFEGGTSAERQVRHCRVTCVVRDDNAAQDRSLGVDFTWEVRSA
ncbi:hypothetical protein CLV92_11450 [Kineococcus xinjiangensis]|uniref:Uncharacterized protein n=1 Tax=Kineococcus xinjiangensis TaxID=512762 RepID=A0A2S6IE23_9ACTN|nr:hypothetical protein [Kineococcus xinjiangensis]PPK92449.1 hypothetical protein CLV92_11450 [Kineococcus xinjiangensis]